MDNNAKAQHLLETPKTLEEVKKYALGEWKSITMELRPAKDANNPNGVGSTYLKRYFNYLESDKFISRITLFADNYGQMSLMEIEFIGNLNWGKAHPIAEGAWEVDYILNEGYGVTAMNDQMATMLNSALPEGMKPFENGKRKELLGKAFPFFNIEEGQVVTDYDLIYFRNGMLFMGAKHVDGTNFDTPERRPHQLQIPLVKIH